MSKLPDSALVYILKGLAVPLSEANVKLSFKPGLFFNDLEKISAKKRQSLKNSYYKAIKSKLIELDDQGFPRLTSKGRKKFQLYEPKKLSNSAKLMVVFDIPEDERHKRRHLRTLLKELYFNKIQQSVWVSSYDCKDYLAAEIKNYNLQKYVFVYEADQLKIV
ncbi:CRISPR-associated endonuclease Cas2 [Candidatus Parcubacteria bacterium]|nr:CRISPR-associated endonuclease Cas2 [Candidatus Parcubacteria bacterium]